MIEWPPRAPRPGREVACFGYAAKGDELLAPDAETNRNPALAALATEAYDAGTLAQLALARDGGFGGWIASERELAVFLDPFGLQEMWVYRGPAGLAIAEDIGALETAYAGRLTPDVEQLRRFARAGKFYGDGTAYREIRRLWGGCVYYFDAESRERVEPYVRYADLAARRVRSQSELTEEVTERLLRIVARSAPSALERLIIPLSGGLDSRLLAAAVAAQGLDAEAVTFGDAGSPDVKLASRVAPILGLPLRHYPVDYPSWPQHGAEAIERTRGQVSVQVLSPPAELVSELRAGSTPLLSGAAGNTTMGGIELDQVRASGPYGTAALSELASGDYGPPAGLLEGLAHQTFCRDVLRILLHVRRGVTASTRDIGAGRYRLPFLALSLLRDLWAAGPEYRASRGLQVETFRAIAPARLLDVPLTGRRAYAHREEHLIVRGLRSLRYRGMKAVGRDLAPGFIDHARILRVHGDKFGAAIRSSALLREAGVALAPRPEPRDIFRAFTLASYYEHRLRPRDHGAPRSA